MIAPDLASKLLEDVIYQRVLGCIDLEELSELEQDLWAAVFDLGPSGEDSWTLAREMLDRAFARLHHDLPYLGHGTACTCDEAAAPVATGATGAPDRREPSA